MEDDWNPVKTFVDAIRQRRWDELNHWNTHEETEMPYYGYSTRDSDIAKAALHALEAGITLEQLLDKNKTVRMWWSAHAKERDADRIRAEREKVRRTKLAEKKKLDEARREAAMEKLTPEEIEAFGLAKKKVTKR